MLKEDILNNCWTKTIAWETICNIIQQDSNECFYDTIQIGFESVGWNLALCLVIKHKYCSIQCALIKFSTFCPSHLFMSIHKLHIFLLSQIILYKFTGLCFSVLWFDSSLWWWQNVLFDCSSRGSSLRLSLRETIQWNQVQCGIRT